MLILGLGLIFVFLILAALYESWKVPFAVLFSVPSGIFGASVVPALLNFVSSHPLSNDIYMQIGILTLIGLAAKNAILIIEYAKVRVDERGMRPVDAAIEAAKIRLRPLLWCWCCSSCIHGCNRSCWYDHSNSLRYLHYPNALYHCGNLENAKG